MNNHRFLITAAALALAALVLPLAALGQDHDADVKTAIKAQTDRAGVIYKRGKQAHYTKKFDLSGLPHYHPGPQLTGWIRLHGNNYLSDGMLGDYWQQGFAKYQPGLRLSYFLPTSAVAFASLYYNQSDIAMDHEPGFYDILAYERVMNNDPVCITAVTGDGDASAGDGEGREISNVIIPNGTPGYEQGEPYRKMGWNASDTRPLSFDECRVPEENLLGERGAGFRQFLHILDIGRIGVAAMGVGLAQGALDEALSYAKERRAFGRAISKFQAIQIKLADMSSEIEAARLLVYKAACEKDAKRNFTLTAAQAKLKTGRLAVRCAEEAVQIHGGYGFIEEYPVCRFYRDAKILTIGEGTDEIQQTVIARALGA